MTVLRWPCSTEFRVLSVEGPLRAPVSTALRHKVRGLIRSGDRHILLDLTEVSRIDAAGLGELVRAYNMARVAKGTLHVVNPTAWVREVIARVGLLDVLKADGMALSIQGTAPGVWPTVSRVAATTAAAMAPTIRGAGVSSRTPMRRALLTPCELFRFPRA
jgi:anti-anti-sigma factor